MQLYWYTWMWRLFWGQNKVFPSVESCGWEMCCFGFHTVSLFFLMYKNRVMIATCPHNIITWKIMKRIFYWIYQHRYSTWYFIIIGKKPSIISASEKFETWFMFCAYWWVEKKWFHQQLCPLADVSNLCKHFLSFFRVYQVHLEFFSVQNV